MIFQDDVKESMVGLSQGLGLRKCCVYGWAEEIRKCNIGQ